MNRIQPLATAFQALRQKQPRQPGHAHLDFIRSLPCISCGWRSGVYNRTEAAHIRMACLKAGKRETGKGEKPSDKWSLPLCAKCHRTGKNSQHNIGEDEFWTYARINPFEVAGYLFMAMCDYDIGVQIVRENCRIKELKPLLTL